LGALLTFAPTPWYAHYAQDPVFGLSALEDQQLGGLVMWVPGGIAYLVAGLAIVAAWLAPGTRRGFK
jgi:putative membrane protein